MTLTVEDGTGLDTADSYVSLTDAAAYATAHNWTDWTAATTANKEAALLQATAYLDSHYRWTGCLVSLTQALGWPRIAYDREGRTLTGVPSVVASATIEAARLALTTALSGGNGTAQVIRRKVDVIETQYAETRPSEVRADRLAFVTSLLSSVTMGGGGIAVVRA